MSDTPPTPNPSPVPGPEVIREFNDRGTLWLLEDPANLRDLVRILEPDLATRLDFGRAVRVNRSFIPADLQKLESDLIFRVPAGAAAGEVWVYVLLEHQSRPDPMMPLRLYEYMGHLWEAQRRDWEDSRVAAAERLRPVVPLVFYTGQESWRGPVRLADLMELPPGLERFVPAWEILFLNLHRTPPETLTRFAGAVGWALRVLQAEQAPLEQLERILAEALAGLEGLSEAQAGQWLRVAWYLVLLAFHRRERDEYTVLQALILEEARSSKFRIREEVSRVGQTMAQYVEERGEARGMRQSLILVLEARFGSLPEAVSAAVAGAELETVTAWLRAAATATSLEAVGIVPA